MPFFRRRLRADQRGATAIEYGLVAGIIAVAIVGIAATGGAVDALYNKLAAIAAGISTDSGDSGSSGGSGG